MGRRPHGRRRGSLNILADIAWNNLPRADRALDLLLRRLDVPQANAWLREFAKVPDRQRALIRATGVIGDPLYIPWLIERMATLETARLAGEAFSMITGLDLAYRDLDRHPPADFQSGPNDDPADENVALDEDENLPWPDPEKIGQWWPPTAAASTSARPISSARRSRRPTGWRRCPTPSSASASRRAGTRHPPARQGDVRGPRARPSATPVDRPRPRFGVTAALARRLYSLPLCLKRPIIVGLNQTLEYKAQIDYMANNISHPVGPNK